MLLSYKRDRLQLLLIISGILLLFGVGSLVTFIKNRDSSLLLTGLYIVQAALFYSIYKYCKTRKYVYICNEYIQCNSLSKPKAYLSDILKVRKRGGFYFIYTSKRTLRINTKLLDHRALDTLEEFIKNLPNALSA